MPFFLPDLSSWQGNAPNFAAIAADPRMAGVIIKSSQGLGPGVDPAHGHSLTWFKDNWTRILAAGGARYGLNWFRGAYHFGTPTAGGATGAASGAAQADYMLSTVEKAGGWGNGDLAPAWDLEGSAWSSKQQILDVSSAFAERVRARLGRSPILYTGSTWRAFKIQEKAGFDTLWTPHLDLMVPFGWPNTNVILHQFAGNGKYYNPSDKPAKLGYPTSVAGFGTAVDMNVVMEGGSPATSIDRVRAVLTGRGGFNSGLDGLVTAPRGVPKSGGISTGALIGAGAGLLTIGILIVKAGSRELV